MSRHHVQRRASGAWIGAVAVAVLAAAIAFGPAPPGSCAGPASAPGASPRPAAAPIAVFVSILPQAYFVERVGGDRVTVDVLVKPGQSPHVFEPTPKAMAALSTARAYFAIGLPFESVLLGRITSLAPGIEIVDTSRGIERRPGEGHDHAENGKPGSSPGAAGSGAAHDEADPHIWVSPRLVKIQAQNICKGLEAVDPAGTQVYRENLALFLSDLDLLDAELAAAFAPLRGRSFLVFHPAFGYLADAYGLRQIPIEVAGKEPGPKELALVIERAKREGIRIIFTEPQFSEKTARAVAREIGGAVVSMDALAYDYLANLRRMAEEVRKGLSLQ